MKTSWKEIDSGLLAANLRSARAAARPGTDLILVVKSDAYGHGMAAVARRALREGITFFAVADVAEGIALRALLPRATILTLCAPAPESVPEILENRLTPVIVDHEHGAALADALRRRRRGRPPMECHAKIDTGMSRLGFDWRRAPAELTALARRPEIEFAGILSHFSAAGGEAPRSAAAQFRRFMDVIKACRKRGLSFPMRHISASGGYCENPEWDLDAVRLGIIMYGYPPGPLPERMPVRPFLQWKTRVLQVKTLPRGRHVGYGNTLTTGRSGRFAVLAVGYADGYDRRLGNRGAVLIDGRRCQVAGRVSMNLTTVALPPGCRAQPGDPAVLIGQQGRASIWADELAGLCGTIPHEILTAIRSP